VTWDDLGVGFTHPPGGAQWANKSVLAYHFYMPPQLTLNGTFVVRMLDIERLNTGAFLTEFDADVLDKGRNV
jgi:endoglycosylceramidase